MTREEAVSTDGMWAGLVRAAPGTTSAWHHHGEYESSIYVLSGLFRLEFGPGGADAADAAPGDFLYVAAGAIHREVNPSAEVSSSVVVVRSGRGEPVFNLDGPEDG
jgi:uncharacterized RmlC-like cupin family protein